MHILLSKVQQKILDEKVEELIDLLENGLASLHIHLEMKGQGIHIGANLAKAYDALLDIIAIQKDFPAYFHNFPPKAKLLAQGGDVPPDERHEVYEWLKSCLLEEENQHGDYKHSLLLFRKSYPVQRALLEPYFQLKQKVQQSDLPQTAKLMERLAYGLLMLLQFTVDEKLLHEAVYRPKPLDNELLLRYNQNRVTHIDEALMSSSIENNEAHTDIGPKRVPCIKCSSYGSLSGYKEKQDGREYFVAHSYTCSHCGFELFDQKDLMLAGMQTIFSFS